MDEQAIGDLEFELTALRKEYAELDKKISSVYDKLTEAYAKIAEERLKEPDKTWLLNMHAEYEHTEPPRILYDALDKWLETLGFTSFGHNLDTLQCSLGISYTDCHKRIDLIESSITYILPYLMPIEDGFTRIIIHSPDCSASGVYGLKFKNNEIKITKTVYGKESFVKQFSSVREALEYIAKIMPLEDDEY